MRLGTKCAVAVFAAVLLRASDPAPSDEEINTDRPDFTESTDVVAIGSVQVESGFTYDSQSNAAGTAETWTGPSTLIRTGVTPWLEFRIGSDGFQHERDQTGSATARHTGFSDLDVEAKFRLLPEKGLRPALGVITTLSVPTGTAGFSENTVNPGLLLCWGKSLPRGFDASGNVIFQWKRDGAETTVSYAQTLSVEHGLPAHFSTYGEVYRMTVLPHEPAAWTFDTGLLRALGRDAQLDVSVGHSLLARTSEWYAGAGVSFRFFLRH